MYEIVSIKSLNEIIREIKNDIKDISKEAYVFGSVVEGYAIKNESDLDLIIVPKRRIAVRTVYSILDKPISKLLDKGIVLHVIVFDKARHSEDLLETARKGVKIV